MTNKPRSIGTAAETAVVRYLRRYWPTADRSPLRGNRDQGDIRGTGEIIWEVKAGTAAKGAGTAEPNAKLIAHWMMQTETERQHADARLGVLVTHRRGYGVGNVDRWWAWLTAGMLYAVTGYGYESNHVVRLELGALIEILGDNGWIADFGEQDVTA